MKRLRMKTDTSSFLFSNKALFALMIPLVVEQLLSMLVGMVDSIMIASVGEAAVSGVSLVDNVMLLIITIFSALATGGAVVAGQYLGQKNTKKARQASGQLVWFIGICSIGIMAVIYVIKPFILNTVFGSISADVAGHANTYLMIVTASVPFIAIYNGGAAVFRTMGNSQITMKVSIIMNLINVVGNAICIYGLHMGTAGVAIPTLISRMAAAVFIIVLLLNRKYELALERTWSYRPNWGMVKKILGIGIPNGMENGMFQLGKLILLSLVSTFGTAAITANAITGVIASLAVLPGMAISLGVTTVISRCVGAGDYEQAKYYNRKLLSITYIAMWLMNAAILLLLPVFLSLYNLSDVTAGLTRSLIICHTMGAVVVWPSAFVLPATFRAAGDAKFTMLVSIFSMWVFRLGMGFILGKFMGLGVLGVWMAMIVDWIFRTIVFAWRYFSGKWKNRRVM